MKFGQIIVSCRTNISNMLLAQCWGLETGPRSFYDLIKITMQRDVAIFSSWHLPFLMVPYLAFQKNEIAESWHNWLLNNRSRLLNLKETGTRYQPSKLFTRFQNIIVLDYVYQLAKFGDFMSCGSKDIFKNAQSRVLILIMTSQIWEGGLKIQNHEILRAEHNFSTK